MRYRGLTKVAVALFSLLLVAVYVYDQAGGNLLPGSAAKQPQIMPGSKSKIFGPAIPGDFLNSAPAGQTPVLPAAEPKFFHGSKALVMSHDLVEKLKDPPAPKVLTAEQVRAMWFPPVQSANRNPNPARVPTQP